MPAPDPITIRPITPDDAPAAAELCAQLGYPASPDDLRARIKALPPMEPAPPPAPVRPYGQYAVQPAHIVLAAVLDGQLVGWIDASIESHLQAPDVVNIGGLVVRDSTRGAGVGRRLCLAIEDWARSQSIPTVRVRSQIRRADAHRFYLRDGYRQVKTSLVFEKTVS
jgi:PhnO protein